jgi:hypothetical protein
MPAGKLLKSRLLNGYNRSHNAEVVVMPQGPRPDRHVINPMAGQCKGEMNHENQGNVAPEHSRSGCVRTGCGGERPANGECESGDWTKPEE